MSGPLEPSPGRPRSLAVYGDAADIRTWSSTAYFFYTAAKRRGFLSNALDLQDPAYESHRKQWRIATLLRLRKPIGYQWSLPAANRMWDAVPAELRGGEFISHFQTFPPLSRAKKGGAVFSYYIDTTLNQLINQPPRQLSGSEKAAIARERDLYHASRFVITMARETARVVIEHYSVDPAKVFAVRPGANLHEPVVLGFLSEYPTPDWRQGAPFTADRPAILGMIANDFLRKGLPKLLKIAEVLHARGRPVRVRMVGNCSDELKQHPLMDYAGFIKKSDEPAFLAALNSFAMGCLLSAAEPLGISTLEALRLGIPVLGHSVGGIPDCVPDDAGLLVEAESTPDEVADRLEPLLFDPTRYAQLCAAASSYSNEVTWDRTVEKMIQIWDGRYTRPTP